MDVLVYVTTAFAILRAIPVLWEGRRFLISFRKPQQANDSIMEADGNIYHYRDELLVGVKCM